MHLVVGTYERFLLGYSLPAELQVIWCCYLMLILLLLLPGSSSCTAPGHCLQLLTVHSLRVLNAVAGGLSAAEVVYTCSTSGVAAGLAADVSVAAGACTAVTLI
jgi:hypothetical protein